MVGYVTPSASGCARRVSVAAEACALFESAVSSKTWLSTSVRTITRYAPGVADGSVAVRVPVYVPSLFSVPVCWTRPSGRSPTSQVASADRYAASYHDPAAGFVLWFVTVHRIWTESPGVAPSGTVTWVTSRSLAGGCSMTVGCVGLRSLFVSFAPSNTMPMTPERTGSAVTNRYHGPIMSAGGVTVTVREYESPAASPPACSKLARKRSARMSSSASREK